LFRTIHDEVFPVKNNQTQTSRDGLTMIEVMMSLGLLMTVMGVAAAGLIQARYIARATAHKAHALQIARSNIEALRYSYGYADPALSVTTGSETHTNMPSDLPQILMVGDREVAVNYVPYYTVSETNLGSGFTYKRVCFVVNWDEPTFTGNKPLSVQADTIIASVLDR
jgi:Tfp pilus assembly protein PilV